MAGINSNGSGPGGKNGGSSGSNSGSPSKANTGNNSGSTKNSGGHQSSGGSTSTASRSGGNGSGNTNKRFYRATSRRPSLPGSLDSRAQNHFCPSSKLRLLHQRTSLSLAYDRDRGWDYEGETSLYVIAKPDVSFESRKNGSDSSKSKSSLLGFTPLASDGKAFEMGLHLRDGCLVESVQIFAAATRTITTSFQRIKDSNETTNSNPEDGDVIMADARSDNHQTDSVLASSPPKDNIKTTIQKVARLERLQRPVTFAHNDPLSIVLTRPASLHSVEDDGDPYFTTNESSRHSNKGNSAASSKRPPPRRYEADTHASRGARGLANSLRAASIASALGELRISIGPAPKNKDSKDKKLRLKLGSAAASNANDANTNSDDTHQNYNSSYSVHTTDGKVATSVTVSDAQSPLSLSEAIQCWKDDLLCKAASIPQAEDAKAKKYGQGHDDCAAGETEPGTIGQKMTYDMARWRCQARRDARINWIAESMADVSVPPKPSFQESETKFEWPLAPAMKIVIRFSLRPRVVLSRPIGPASIGDQTGAPASFTTHLGGLSFCAPPPLCVSTSTGITSRRTSSTSSMTPHVYTISGTHGDHQGVRSWLPTLDSASSLHRASHELSIKVTALGYDGLWPTGSGEDFGYNESVSHPILGTNISETIFAPLSTHNDYAIYQAEIKKAEKAWRSVGESISKALGARHARFINEFFYGEGDDEGTAIGEKLQNTSSESPVSSSDMTSSSTYHSSLDSVELDSAMMLRIRLLRPTYVTSIFSSSLWSPCPSRSLGFVVGPFATLYDPEYFRLDKYDDDEDDHGMDDDGEDDENITIQETARKLGEGIRQLYFMPHNERQWIHAGVDDKLIFGMQLTDNESILQQPEHPKPSSNDLQVKRRMEKSIIGATVGVPNRALSLMRDVLALPAYRTSSYTQIWIPEANMSGSTSGGNIVGCPEVAGCNPFLGGAIIDSTLLPPPDKRLPYYNEGRILQFIQARNAVRGWVRAALPLGSDDDVGQGYIHTLIETFIMSLYERGHGAFGEGGGKGSFFYTKRYAIGSGLNSPNLDFLPLVNIEDDEAVGGALGAVPIEERGNEHLWRSANNGTETHTSSLDEFSIGQLQAKDFIEAIERNDKAVPLPSMGWLGSHLSVTFLSHNSSSSTLLGCGALDFVHPSGGQVYRALKSILLSKIFEGRAGISNFTRVIRAAFIASFLSDIGVTQLELPEEEKGDDQENDADVPPPARPPFVICIEEIIKKQALSHAIITRALRVMSGPIHEPYLRGNLVDIGRENYDSRHERKLVEPEGFPNSYVRGASGLYMRIGAHVEAADGSSDGAAQSASAATQSAAAVKGIHLHVVVEPVVPEGGSIFGGPVTLRVIENEGQCREFIKNIPEDGSRTEWGPIFLHARPVSTAKQQQAASGISDAPSTGAAAAGTATAVGGARGVVTGGTGVSGAAFTYDHLHREGFQALELIRITNITPLLWVRVDPHGLYNGRFHIFQQDACLAEQLFHDGDASGQVEAIRALAERPLKIQGTLKITNVHDVPISELPVRVLADCLRGSVSLHCDLPHNPAIRAQAALAIAQWQNNKAPESRDVVGGSAWLGLDLLMQYFKERYYNNGIVLPMNFRRLVLHKHISGAASGSDTTSDGGYQYLDAISEKEERKSAIDFADEIEIEEDEEYRVRSACVTAIASIRSQDGMTPQVILKFLHDVLQSGDNAAVGSLLLPNEEEQLKKKQEHYFGDETTHGRRIIGPNDEDVSNLAYAPFSLVADALLALCYVHVRPQCDFDPTTGRPVQVKADHPILPLIESCRSWLDWDLERENVRAETEEANLTGIGDACNATISPCAITALCHLVLLKQSTTSSSPMDKGSTSEAASEDDVMSGAKRTLDSKSDEPTRAQFYVDIFDHRPVRNDATRAAAAQSVACICCAADRNESSTEEPLGLLLSLEFMLDRILEPSTSPGLRLTLALLMMDACTGRICSLQRVSSFCRQGSFVAAGSRFMNGPLGPSYGGDNGSALLMTVSDVTYPAANAVNDGARRGLRLLKDNCKDSAYSNQTLVRVAKFASQLWRTINGELVLPNESRNWQSYQSPSVNAPSTAVAGVCAHDSHLRCGLIALWQWIWPRHCYQLMRSQSWHALEGTPQYYSIGLDNVMKTTAEDKEVCAAEDHALMPLAKVIESEIDRQRWRGEMAAKAYEYFKRENKGSNEIGQPLPVVEKDAAWKLGGWVASASQQRRARGADGGSAVTKIRLLVKNNGGEG